MAQEDNNIKSALDSSFDQAGINVSEDLIAATLAAIPAARDSEAAKWTLPDMSPADYQETDDSDADTTETTEAAETSEPSLLTPAEEHKITELKQRRRRRRLIGEFAGLAALFAIALLSARNYSIKQRDAASLDTNAAFAPMQSLMATDTSAMVTESFAMADSICADDEADIYYTAKDEVCTTEACTEESAPASSSSANGFSTGFADKNMVAMPNPMRSVDLATLADTFDLTISLPADADDLSVSIISGDLAQLSFMLGDIDCTARYMLSDTFEDISGMYYTWSYSVSETQGPLEVYSYQNTEDPNVALCIIHDTEAGKLYSFSMLGESDPTAAYDLVRSLFNL